MLRFALLATCLLALPRPVGAQSGRVAPDQEHFRSAPGGTILATLLQGIPLRLGRTDGDWREATVEGWIWGASIRAERRDGKDLVVSSAGGENLRATPNGPLLARLREGMLLNELERRGSWIRVSRAGWIWNASLALDETAPPAANSQRPQASAGPATPPRPGRGGQPADSAARAATPPAADWSHVPESGAALLATPAGDTLATLRPLTPVEIVTRDGNWVRVRVDGWAWAPSLATAADSGAVLRNVPRATVVANPDRFQGRIVEWKLQFIGFDRAEAIRTDFQQGEPFILARDPAEQGGFVYVAISTDRLAQVQALTPLQRITVVGRIRTGRSPLMDAPVLELLTLR